MRAGMSGADAEASRRHYFTPASAAEDVDTLRRFAEMNDFGRKVSAIAARHVRFQLGAAYNIAFTSPGNAGSFTDAVAGEFFAVIAPATPRAHRLRCYLRITVDSGFFVFYERLSIRAKRGRFLDYFDKL